MAFETSVSTLDELLNLLERREGDEKFQSTDQALTRRAVHVSARCRAVSTDYGVPSVTRTVVAAFAYGEDLVSFTRTTSRGIEFPAPATDAKEARRAQEEALREIRSAVEAKLSDLGLSRSVPVLHAGLAVTPKPGG